MHIDDCLLEVWSVSYTFQMLILSNILYFADAVINQLHILF